MRLNLGLLKNAEGTLTLWRFSCEQNANSIDWGMSQMDSKNHFGRVPTWLLQELGIILSKESSHPEISGEIRMKFILKGQRSQELGKILKNGNHKESYWCISSLCLTKGTTWKCSCELLTFVWLALHPKMCSYLCGVSKVVFILYILFLNMWKQKEGVLNPRH